MRHELNLNVDFPSRSEFPFYASLSSRHCSVRARAFFFIARRLLAPPLQEVAHAGKMKREELLEYLKTPEGESLAIKVAKLLDHAQRTEVLPPIGAAV